MAARRGRAPASSAAARACVRGRGAHHRGVTGRRGERELRSRGLALLGLGLSALAAAVALPFAGAPLGVSEALLVVAIPCTIAGLIRRYRRD